MSREDNTQAGAGDAPESPTVLCHPFFDIDGPPNGLDCLDAINRTICVIELFTYLKLENEPKEGLSSRAASGYWWLLMMLQDTLKFSSRRLNDLSQKRRKKDRYLSVLLQSLSELGDADCDSLLNAMAAQLQISRSRVDRFINKARNE